MRVSYRPTFSQFSDNYLSTHYSGGVQTLRRLAGGPLLILLGAVAMIAARAWLPSSLLRFPLVLVGFLVALAGALYAFQPLLNVFLVWLRRDELFGEGQKPTKIELKRGILLVSEGEEELKLPLEQIKSIQHRSDSSWILTQGDYLISVPRQGLLEGEHDAFIEALETAIAPEEEED